MKTTAIISIASAKLRLLIENGEWRIENFPYINTFLTYIKNGRTLYLVQGSWFMVHGSWFSLCIKH